MKYPPREHSFSLKVTFGGFIILAASACNPAPIQTERDAAGPASTPQASPIGDQDAAPAQTENSGTTPRRLKFSDPEVIQTIAKYLKTHEDELLAERCEHFKTGLEKAIRDARAGDAFAHWYAANLYRTDTCIRDRRKSALWMEKAASRGVVDAIRDTGMNYLLGKGVLEDHRKAFAYLTVYVAVADHLSLEGVTSKKDRDRALAEIKYVRVWIDVAEKSLHGRELQTAKRIAEEVYNSLPEDLIQQDEFYELEKIRLHSSYD